MYLIESKQFLKQYFRFTVRFEKWIIQMKNPTTPDENQAPTTISLKAFCLKCLSSEALSHNPHDWLYRLAKTVYVKT